MEKLILFTITFIISALLVQLTIKFCKRFALYDETNSRKIHSGNIPRLGGVGIFISFIIGCIFYYIFSKQTPLKNLLPLVIAVFIIFSFGVLDDLINMKAIYKLIAHIVATTIVIFAGFRFQYIFSIPLHSSFIARVISYSFTLFWVIGLINAYNLIDGLDGLCGTLSLSVFLTMAVIYNKYNSISFFFCLTISASILGFLLYNFYNAKIFMGDNGSQVLGFLVAILPLTIQTNDKLDFEFNKFLILLNLTSIPVMDIIAAIWRRLRDHKPIFSPDRSHLHHKLLNVGFSKFKALLLLIGIQSFICLIVILSIHVDRNLATCILCITYFIIITLFAVIHYVNRNVLKKNIINNFGEPK